MSHNMASPQPRQRAAGQRVGLDPPCPDRREADGAFSLPTNRIAPVPRPGSCSATGSTGDETSPGCFVPIRITNQLIR
jgi:hypothetical protein